MSIFFFARNLSTHTRRKLRSAVLGIGEENNVLIRRTFHEERRKRLISFGRVKSSHFITITTEGGSKKTGTRSRSFFSVTHIFK